MDRVTSAAIDFVEAAYDLGEAEWLRQLLEVGLPIIDGGLGVAGIVYDRPPEGGPVVAHRVHVASGPVDFVDRYSRAKSEIPLEIVREMMRPCLVGTLSEVTADYPEAFAIINRHFDYWKDALRIIAVDPNGLGVHLVVGLPEVTKLTGRARERWQMLGAHLSAGYRLRRALATESLPVDGEPTDLPLDAEAMLDPKRFQVAEAAGAAKSRSAATKLRNAAIQIDRARGRLRKDDPEKALEIWGALVRGRWSMVDWFDSDGRRFMLAIPNSPKVSDPRGLTERETQVVTYAAFGHSNKLIAYQLGISKARVSLLLNSSMRKLGARTHAQLVKKMRDLRGLRVKEVQQ